MTTTLTLQPRDQYNQTLLENVHPPDWINPRPKDRYHLVVVGAGTAGLVTAAIAAGLGAKVALIERNLMGGDCLNVGCVPSKALLSTARRIRQIKSAESFGIDVAGFSIDFSRVMARMRRLRAEISPHDSANRFRQLGIDVFLGQGTFVATDRIRVDDAQLKFRKAVIATGARAAAPPIEGLDQIDYLTNETLFSLTELPTRLGVIGAGPIGCEMAQAFANFGSEVLLVEAMHGVLPREDRQAAGIVERSLASDGVQLLCCGKQLRLQPDGPQVRLQVDSHGESYDEPVDRILVAVGRAPNVDGLGLEAAGVDYDAKKGVVVDDKLRTTNPKIYAAGDICSPYQFTHAADFMARLVVRNALFPGSSKASDLVIPWCTYTAPELAQVGLTEQEAEQKKIPVQVVELPLTENDRALLEGESSGFVKVLLKQGSDRIVGGTVVASHAGDLISEITMAMTLNLGLKKIGQTIHPYPTQADAVRRLADLYQRTQFGPRAKRLIGIWLKLIG